MNNNITQTVSQRTPVTQVQQTPVTQNTRVRSQPQQTQQTVVQQQAPSVPVPVGNSRFNPPPVRPGWGGGNNGGYTAAAPTERFSYGQQAQPANTGRRGRP